MQVVHLPPVVKALIFDIDNTLYSHDGYCRLQVDLLIRRFAEHRGVSFDEARALIEEEKQRYTAEHEGAQTSIANIMSALGVSIKENARWRDELFNPEDYLNPDEKTIRAVKKLSSQFAIAAVTNNTVGIGRRTLTALGLQGLIPLVVGLDSCYVSKPAREPFETALRKLGASPGSSVSLGDRYDVDLQVPLSMGMGGILIEGSSDLHELPALLRRQ